MEASDSARLAGLLRADPQQGLAEAIQLWSGPARAICGSILSGLPQEEAEECLADCFFLLWRDICRYDPQRGELKGWFFGLCRNTALNRHRAAARRLQSPPAPAGPPGFVAGRHPVAGGGDHHPCLGDRRAELQPVRAFRRPVGTGRQLPHPALQLQDGTLLTDAQLVFGGGGGRAGQIALRKSYTRILDPQQVTAIVLDGTVFPLE